VFKSYKAEIVKLMNQRLLSYRAFTLPKEMAIGIAGEAYITKVVSKKKSTMNGFSTCGIWPLSQPKMQARHEKYKENGVKGTLGTEAWLIHRGTVRKEVLVLPPKREKGRRKRVDTASIFFVQDELQSIRQPKQAKKTAQIEI